jgi:leucyl aminopeptidase
MTIRFDTSRETPADAAVLAVPVFAGIELPDPTAAELDRAFLAARGFEAKPGEVLPLLAEDGTTVLAVGMGDRDAITAETFRKVGAAIARNARSSQSIATTVVDVAPRSVGRSRAAQAVVEGAALAAYEFGSYKSSPKPSAIERFTVVAGDRAAREGARRGARVAEAVALARDLVNEPPGTLTPTRFADIAVEVGERSGLDVTIFDEERIAAERLGGLAGVAAGSDEPARLIRMEYRPDGGGSRTVALVGKGITFDSGGLSLKTGAGMMTMKDDMGGGAAVLGAMSALRDLEVDVHVIGFIPATENMPSGKATRPGDVLRARNGKTIEVLNTDAEGRLILADGLSLAVEEQPDLIVDLATLTGAQIVALGMGIAAIMGNDDSTNDELRAAGDRAGERLWPLPLPGEYRSHIDSDIADMKNIGRTGQAGTIIAGLFLKEFVAEVPWAHLDIAGPGWSEEDEGYTRKGGTGFGVRTLLELLSTAPS